MCLPGSLVLILGSWSYHLMEVADEHRVRPHLSVEGTVILRSRWVWEPLLPPALPCPVLIWTVRSLSALNSIPSGCGLQMALRHGGGQGVILAGGPGSKMRELRVINQVTWLYFTFVTISILWPPIFKMLQEDVSWVAGIKEGPDPQPQMYGGDRRERAPRGEGGHCTCACLGASGFSFSKERASSSLSVWEKKIQGYSKSKSKRQYS